MINGCMALLAAALFAGCKGESREGTYVAKLKSEFSVADDTIELKGDVIYNRVGYNRIDNGQLKQKRYSFRTWKLNSPEAPIIVFGDDHVTIGRTQYKKIK